MSMTVVSFWEEYQEEVEEEDGTYVCTHPAGLWTKWDQKPGLFTDEELTPLQGLCRPWQPASRASAHTVDEIASIEEAHSYLTDK